jgi:hypothetical protein
MGVGFERCEIRVPGRGLDARKEGLARADAGFRELRSGGRA